MTEQVLTPRELNRATLARQMLLRRERLDPVDAIERLVALQAQEPASPYIALWTRLERFRAEDLDRAFLERRVVKTTLLRATLHAVTAGDYRCFWPAVAPALRRWREQTMQGSDVGLALDELAEMALAYGSEPRTNAAMRAHLAPMDAGVGPAPQRDSWWAVRVVAPFVTVPARDVPWCFGRRPAYVAARTWLGEPMASEQEGLDHLIGRYLRGFGPATLGDIHQFTRVERARLKPALERLAPHLRLFRDERGGVLHDLPDAPLPEATTPAPPRFLPMWDSTLLAYDDRSRIIPDGYRRRVIQVNGDFLPALLVDGYVAGVWRADIDDGRTTIRWEAFEPLSEDAEAQVAEEAERLARFVEPIEPGVYRRYAKTWLK